MHRFFANALFASTFVHDTHDTCFVPTTVVAFTNCAGPNILVLEDWADLSKETTVYSR